ncbi:MAG: molybdate ABC transporter substrate-binding protein [SAR202 cluster bacterium]|nr:molybdate ABC transporter substrate-binding protein [SAR202 cluster bacterium]|tara:strand:+ start:32590 stop:33414 length:825 start_codon:yes stop_codon:yes gene_type:complete
MLLNKSKKILYFLYILPTVFILWGIMNLIYNNTADKNSSVVTVFAASSLTDSFTAIGDLFMADNSDYDIVFNFAGTSTLNAQLRHGANADIFAAASESQIKVAYDNGFIDNYTVFARNKLVLITPFDNNNIKKIEDIGNKGVRLVLSNEVVPSGNYSNKTLLMMEESGLYGEGFYNRVIENVVSEEINVRQVVAKILLNEADAGLVYITDVTDNNNDRMNIIHIPEIHMPEILYPIAVIIDGSDKSGASRFMEFVLSDSAQELLSKHGFGIIEQ